MRIQLNQDLVWLLLCNLVIWVFQLTHYLILLIILNILSKALDWLAVKTFVDTLSVANPVLIPKYI